MNIKTYTMINQNVRTWTFIPSNQQNLGSRPTAMLFPDALQPGFQPRGPNRLLRGPEVSPVAASDSAPWRHEPWSTSRRGTKTTGKTGENHPKTCENHNKIGRNDLKWSNFSHWSMCLFFWVVRVCVFIVQTGSRNLIWYHYVSPTWVLSLFVRWVSILLSRTCCWCMPNSRECGCFMRVGSLRLTINSISTTCFALLHMYSKALKCDSFSNTMN